MNPEENEEYLAGCLSTFRNLSKEQKDLFIKLISDDCSYVFQILFNVIDNNLLTLELLDILSGVKISFPNRKKMYKLLEKIQIYTYINSKGRTLESYQLLAKQYKKRISQIKAIVDRVEHLLNDGAYKDIEKDSKGE